MFHVQYFCNIASNTSLHMCVSVCLDLTAVMSINAQVAVINFVRMQCNKKGSLTGRS
jgi:hypothetical protein